MDSHRLRRTANAYGNNSRGINGVDYAHTTFKNGDINLQAKYGESSFEYTGGIVVPTPVPTEQTVGNKLNGRIWQSALSWDKLHNPAYLDQFYFDFDKSGSNSHNVGFYMVRFLINQGTTPVVSSTLTGASSMEAIVMGANAGLGLYTAISTHTYAYRTAAETFYALLDPAAIQAPYGCVKRGVWQTVAVGWDLLIDNSKSYAKMWVDGILVEHIHLPVTTVMWETQLIVGGSDAQCIDGALSHFELLNQIPSDMEVYALHERMNREKNF